MVAHEQDVVRFSSLFEMQFRDRLRLAPVFFKNILEMNVSRIRTSPERTSRRSIDCSDTIAEAVFEKAHVMLAEHFKRVF